MTIETRTVDIGTTAISRQECVDLLRLFEPMVSTNLHPAPKLRKITQILTRLADPKTVVILISNDE